MFADNLKKSILQAAIQGKLTEQLPSDGNASDLLAQIQAEKLRLVKEKKIKSSESLPPVSDDEIPFDIPQNWCWVRLGDIVSILGDGIHGTPNYDSNGEFYFINGNNLNNGKITIKSDTKRVNLKEYEKYKKNLSDTTVLVSINGTLGNIAFYNEEKIILGKSACYFNLLGKISKFFIKILLSTEFFLLYANDKATGSTIKNVSLQAMRNFLVPLPPLPEQKRIVAKVEELLAEIEPLSHAENDLEQLENDFPKRLKASLLQAAIQGKLSEQLPTDGDARQLLHDIQLERQKLIKQKKIKAETLPPISTDEIPFDIPENWCWVRLGDICEIIGGGTPDKSNTNYWNGNINWATVSDMNSDFINDTILKITEEGLNNSSTNIIKKDSLIVATRVGLGKICYNNIDTAINQDLKGIYLLQKINREYIFYYFKSVSNYIIKNGTGTTVKGIKLDFLKNLLIPLPPLSEQKRIVGRLETLFQEI